MLTFDYDNLTQQRLHNVKVVAWVGMGLCILFSISGACIQAFESIGDVFIAADLIASTSICFTFKVSKNILNDDMDVKSLWKKMHIAYFVMLGVSVVSLILGGIFYGVAMSIVLFIPQLFRCVQYVFMIRIYNYLSVIEMMDGLHTPSNLESYYQIQHGFYVTPQNDDRVTLPSQVEQIQPQITPPPLYGEPTQQVPQVPNGMYINNAIGANAEQKDVNIGERDLYGGVCVNTNQSYEGFLRNNTGNIYRL